MKHILRFNTLNESLSISDLKVRQKVKYKQKGYDNSKSSDEQKDLIEEKPIDRIDVEKGLIFFKDHNGKEFSKGLNDIIEDKKEIDWDKLKQDLGEMKDDKDKIDKILNYVEFLKRK